MPKAHLNRPKIVNIMYFLQSVAILALYLMTNFGLAQEWPGIKDSLYSQVLDENREFQVILPRDYISGAKDQLYEVIYVMDGQYYIEQVPFIYNWTVESGYMPQTILVIVPNVFISGVNQRMRDFTPTNSPDEEYQGAVSGGANNFLLFMNKELAPYIEKKYPANSKKSLLGSSLSGLFVVYAFVENPGFFNSYIASDPALWWDNEYVGKLAAKRLPTFSNIGSTFWIAGLEHSYDGMGIRKIDSVLQSKNVDNPWWKCQLYSNETHFSVQHKAFYDGLRFSYFGYNTGGSTDYHPMNGILEKGKPITVHVFNTDSLLNPTYTLDGSEPKRTSKKINEGDDIVIMTPTQLKIKSFGNRDEFNTLVEGNFVISSQLPKNKKRIPEKETSLRYSYFEGKWDSFPDSKTLKPTHSESIQYDLEKIKLKKGKSSFIHLIEGNFEVKEDGYYVFGINSEEGGKLFIGDAKLFDFDKDDNSEQSFVVPLKKGFYPIRLELFSREESGEIEFSCFHDKGNKPWWQNEISILPEIVW